MNLLDLDYSDYSENSRVWMYIADKRLTVDQAKDLGDRATQYCENWKSHGAPVNATSLVLEDQVLIFLVEEEDGVVGGCSIDSSVNFVKELGAIYKVDFFNRMLCPYIEEESLVVVPTSELQQLSAQGVVNKDSLVINTLIKTRVELENNLFIPMESSWYTRYIK